MSSSCDVLVIGAGVVGCSVAFHLARLGAGRVTVLERRQVGAGTTSQSSGILRTHYSVPENVEMARRSWRVFEDFPAYLEDDEASAGLVRCGYMIVAPEGPRLEALRASLAQQQAMGIPVEQLTPQQAADRLPIARFDDGMPAVLSRTAGSGRVLLVNTSPDNTGSDWPKHKTFVPAIHGIARHLAGRTDDRLLLAGLAVTLGDEAELPAPAGASSARKLVGPDGRERPAPPEEAGLIHLEPDLPGAWSLRETNGAPLLQLAAQLPPAESILESARPDDITRRIPRRESAATGDIAAAWTGNDRQRLEYWRPLLLAAILLLLAETIVANRSTT